MYLICNHKNNLTYNEVKSLKENLEKLDSNNIDLIISPSYPYFYSFIRYNLASQDISIYDNGKTGEISGKQLKSLLVKYVIVGHVERRKSFNEDINVLIKKIANAHKNDIKVIYCFTSYEKDSNISCSVIKKEYEMVKDYLNNDDLIAFEPEWAIGNTNDLNYDYLNEVIIYISKITNRKIIYGGSVNEKTINNLIKIDKLDGFLVSTISNDVDKLQIIIDKMT